MDAWQRIDCGRARTARALLTRCCGSTRWVERMLQRRPFGSDTQLLAVARERMVCADAGRLARGVPPPSEDRRPRGAARALSCHGRPLGQRAAGVAGASDATLDALAEGNRAYEEKFGLHLHRLRDRESRPTRCWRCCERAYERRGDRRFGSPPASRPRSRSCACSEWRLTPSRRGGHDSRRAHASPLDPRHPPQYSPRTMPGRRPRKPNESRRSFLRRAVTGAGATAAAALTTGSATRARTGRDGSCRCGCRRARFVCRRSLRPQRLRSPVRFDFPMTGAQVFARACKEEGVAALFACPGNYPVIHAIAAAGIPAYGGRHEGSMAHAADAFIRVTGEIAVGSGTEGPGFTDMICAIACANAARTPLLVVASNMSIGAGRHRSRHPARLSAADDRRAEEVREAADHPAPRPRIRRLRVPAAARAACRSRCTSTFRPKSRRRGSRTRPSSSSSTTSRAIAPSRGRIRRRRTSPRAVDMIRKAAAADHRLEQRRLLRQGVGRAEAVRREGADSGRRIGRDEGAVLRREPAVGQRGADRARERGPGHPRRPALHADRRRVRVRSGCAVHPHRSGARRHRPQPADRSRHRQLRAARRSRRSPTRCRR